MTRTAVLSTAAAAAVVAPWSVPSAFAAQPPPKSPRVYAFRDHCEAILAWSESRLSGHLSPPPSSSSEDDAAAAGGRPATLVHFDSHADMGLPAYFSDLREMSPLELAQKVNINNFIPPAILAGLVDRVVWVMPEWGTELDYGRYEYYVAEDPSGDGGRGAFWSDAPFSPEVVLSSEEREDLENVRRYRLDVVPFTAELLDELALSLSEEGRPFILDIDLDVFSTENFSCKVLRESAGLSVEEVERFEHCVCHNAEAAAAVVGEDAATEAKCAETVVRGRSVPSEFADAVEGLAEHELDMVTVDLCYSPVHYSTQEEISASIDLMLSWARRLRDKGGVSPGVITVSESSNGYLPPQALELVRGVATGLGEIFGSDDVPPRWIECSICVKLVVRNDLEWEVDLYYVNDQWGDTEDKLSSPLIWYETLFPGQDYRMSAFAGSSFLLTTLEGTVLHAQIPIGHREYIASVSEMEELPESPVAVTVTVRNDLDDDVDLFLIQRGGGNDGETAEGRTSWSSAPLEFRGRTAPGSDSATQHAVMGTKFILETADGDRRFLLRVVPDGRNTELTISASQLKPLEEQPHPIRLVLRNDLEMDVDLYWLDEDSHDDVDGGVGDTEEGDDDNFSFLTPTFVHAGHIPRGGDLLTYAGHSFLLKNAEDEEDSRRFLLHVRTTDGNDYEEKGEEDEEQIILLSQLDQVSSAEAEMETDMNSPRGDTEL